MRRVRLAPSRRLGIFAGAFSFLLLSTMLIAGPSGAASRCSSPPETLPVSDIRPGMTGVGYTVLQGTTQSSFNIKVLGIEPNGIYLGIDLIVMQMTGPQSFIDITGGAVGGMSGSPVYINGKLAGAVAWAIANDRRIFGATAAEDMVGLFSYGGGGGSRVPDSVSLTGPIRRAIASATGASLDQTASTMQALPAPLGVSGLAPGKTLSDVQAKFAKHGISVAPFAASSASSPGAGATDATPFLPGDGFGVGLSYGDVSYYTFGTTTAVCGNLAIAFGHPFNGNGSTLLGLNAVDVLGVDNSVFWGTKMGTLGALHGAMTQDRFMGVLGEFGAQPATVPVDSAFTGLDTGITRNGHTDISWDEDWFVPDVVWSHAYENVLYVSGQAWTPGTLGMDWTIRGTREDGSPWSVSNRTMQFSQYGAGDGIWPMVNMLYSIAGNGYEDITFTGVKMGGSVTENNLTSHIVKIRTSSSVDKKLKARGTLRARPGDRIKIEVTFQPVTGDRSVGTVTLKLPRGAKGTQTISLRGGKERNNRYGRFGSFDEMLAAMSDGQHANDLIVTGFGRQVVDEQDVIVHDKASIRVEIV